MVSIDDRPADATDRRVPGAWEGDLIIGAHRRSAAVTLVERHSRYVVILGLPEGKDAAGVADVLIDRVDDLPVHLRGSLTWDQGTEMARHQPYLDAIAEQLNDRPRQALGFLTPREVFERLLVDAAVASTT